MARRKETKWTPTPDDLLGRIRLAQRCRVPTGYTLPPLSEERKKEMVEAGRPLPQEPVWEDVTPGVTSAILMFFATWNPEQECCVGAEYIGWHTNYSERMVSKGMGVLREAGILIRTGTPGSFKKVSTLDWTVILSRQEVYDAPDESEPATPGVQVTRIHSGGAGQEHSDAGKPPDAIADRLWLTGSQPLATKYTQDKFCDLVKPLLAKLIEEFGETTVERATGTITKKQLIWLHKANHPGPYMRKMLRTACELFASQPMECEDVGPGSTPEPTQEPAGQPAPQPASRQPEAPATPAPLEQNPAAIKAAMTFAKLHGSEESGPALDPLVEILAKRIDRDDLDQRIANAFATDRPFFAGKELLHAANTFVLQIERYGKVGNSRVLAIGAAEPLKGFSGDMLAKIRAEKAAKAAAAAEHQV